MELPNFEGWHLIGSFPRDDPDGVGSWLLAHGGEALLLEIPPGLRLADVRGAAESSGVVIRFVTASHEHYDHLDRRAWGSLAKAFPAAEMIHPTTVRGDRMLSLNGEPVWLVKAPKHSACDVVTIFRGVAMTGDIETGTLESVNEEVPLPTKKKSMARLRDFPERCDYRVHSTVSAHLNSVRIGVNWPDLFNVS
jgi:hypothetical protein